MEWKTHKRWESERPVRAEERRDGTRDLGFRTATRPLPIALLRQPSLTKKQYPIWRSSKPSHWSTFKYHDGSVLSFRRKKNQFTKNQLVVFCMWSQDLLSRLVQHLAAEKTWNSTVEFHCGIRTAHCTSHAFRPVCIQVK